MWCGLPRREPAAESCLCCMHGLCVWRMGGCVMVDFHLYFFLFFATIVVAMAALLVDRVGVVVVAGCLFLLVLGFPAFVP
ncbi:hypothetical protein CCHOA_00325 [Corynebacterium choanae]|uniref:Uncharacterized protein n=1 Tax=Corynebacterium choanae TaxID=1862358 RepID=A0A3G6J3A6_9CORY|nr:hypothetical protein CCHOA_00325 [Corynebacterium choanae]